MRKMNEGELFCSLSNEKNVSRNNTEESSLSTTEYSVLGMIHYFSILLFNLTDSPTLLKLKQNSAKIKKGSIAQFIDLLGGHRSE